MQVQVMVLRASMVLGALLLMIAASVQAIAQGRVLVVNNTTCTISVTTSLVSALVPPGTHVVSTGCPLPTSVTVYSCGAPVQVPMGRCRYGLWLDGCCHADVCLSFPDEYKLCQYTLTITPRDGFCPCADN